MHTLYGEERPSFGEAQKPLTGVGRARVCDDLSLVFPSGCWLSMCNSRHP